MASLKAYVGAIKVNHPNLETLMLWDMLSAGATRTYKRSPGKEVSGSFTLNSGETLDIEDWRGHPVLVVNTATRCGFANQYQGLQEVYDQYREQGLMVLAVSSGDFFQERDSAEAVKEYCETAFGLDYPMTVPTHVKGRNAHPFYQAVRSETGFFPAWNFNKVMIGPNGQVRATWGAHVRPEAREVKKMIEALLAEESD